MRGVDEVVGQRHGHVLALVQLLWGNDAVLLTAQVTGEAVHGDLTCKRTEKYVDM